MSRRQELRFPVETSAHVGNKSSVAFVGAGMTDEVLRYGITIASLGTLFILLLFF
jgi:hypothetical protein